MTGKKYGVITFFALALWMAFIFCMSHQPAEESAAISDTVSYRAVAAVDKIFNLRLAQRQLEERAQKIHYPVRKAAHMTEYAILALLLSLYLSAYKNISGKRRYALAAILAVLYAMTDEYHQTFIAGRHGSFVDVAIDSVGALAGLLLLWSVTAVRKKRAGKRKWMR